MSDYKSIDFKIRESMGMRMAVLFGSFFILLLLSSFIAQLLSQSDSLSERTILLTDSVVQSVLAFCIPAFLLSLYAGNQPLKWLHLEGTGLKLKWFVGVIIVYVISLPAMETLIEWNENLHLPESLSQIETIFRNWEDNGAATTSTLLDAHGFWSVLAGVLIIGVLTGFSEEIFFRGGFQQILSQGSLGKNASILIAALIFSVMHFQFFGFFPRLLMGIFFGYLLFWTRNLWVPVFAHALNNSIVVILEAVTDKDKIQLTGTVGEGGVPYMGFISIVLTFCFFYFFRNSFFKKT